MGGDRGCRVVVEGARLALRAYPKIASLYLVGDQVQIRAALAAGRPEDSRLQIVHASQVLTMEDKPLVALRKKKDCSIARAVELVADGRAEAVISPGNTGGVVAVATVRLRRLEPVDRPGIVAVIPAPENEFVLIDRKSVV